MSPKLPLHKSPEDGYYALTKTHHEVIRQNLKNLILTVPGERIMIPDFGVGLKKLLFEQRDPDIYASICARIDQQTTQYMPFVTIEDVEIIDSEIRWTLSGGEPEFHSSDYLKQNSMNSNTIKIRIMFFIRALNSRAILSFRV